jgi:hypothetical protein
METRSARPSCVHPPQASRSRRRHSATFLSALLACVGVAAHAQAAPLASEADTRSGAGAKRDEPTDDARDEPATERRRVDVTIEARMGAASDWSYAGVEVPIASRLSLTADASLVQVRPGAAAPADARATLHPELGLGAGFQLSEDVTVSVAGYFAPRADDVSSVGGEASLEVEGGDELHDGRDRRWGLEATVGTTRYAFTSLDAGATSTGVARQHYAEIAASLWPFAALRLQPHASVYAYQSALSLDESVVLGALTHDEHSGTRAPRWRAGARATYGDGWAVRPWVEANAIGYASGAGHATELLAGAALTLGEHAHALVGGGVALDRVTGVTGVTDATAAAPSGATTRPVIVVALAASF